ncbi:maltose alpha-D-glucosyltransferase [Methylovorus sp. MP688]|uniref:maltose alpha-D-glucosyltransferase n=1 Tax=Methylovorus sp. (strain MP688) TaxID=887061 RepID=UPI0001EC4E86|nr:maltose alpha-D-glucosyltransferase [Methylovorus sp. MP688]ADQ85646.1 trehalose synthase [Methylovorus sp. MP688]
MPTSKHTDKKTTDKKRTDRRSSALQFTRDPLWYKDAVIYQVHVKSFFDGNNDGIGDFAGLIQKLDYIVSLGVNTLWLLPFYPSPRRDDGYDISDYRGVHPDYGNLFDVKRFIAEAHKHGLRVITELIINHTSDQHPWFQRARQAKPGSAARNFYVWSDTDTAYSQTRIIFTDTEKSNWTWDPVANAFYWHRFFSHQPDLNYDNPRVFNTVMSIMEFWLDLGVDGLRLDAVPYLIEREGTSNENLPETHQILKKIRQFIDQRYPDRMLLAEANMWPEDVQYYFGNNDECHMAFHFPLMPRMYLALAQEDRFPITDILQQTPDIPSDCQWAIFLRNHDELTLEMVTDNERAYMLNFYAADNRARLNVGIRRRLAPLLQRDRRRLELLNSLLLSMPGTPVIYYGDEIGMGDNIHLGDRDGVRTPMQWTPDRNGGFSLTDPARLVLPLNMDTLYGYQAVNVEAQSADPHSLLNWMRRLLAVRKQFYAFGRGSFRLLYPANRKILAYLREYKPQDILEHGSPNTAFDPTADARANSAPPPEKTQGEAKPGETPSDQPASIKALSDEILLCVANVGSTAQAVELDLSEYAGYTPTELMGGEKFPVIGPSPYVLTLAPYDFYWFRLSNEQSPLATPSRLSAVPFIAPEYRTLVLNAGIHDLMQPRLQQRLETEIFPAYLARQRWFASHADTGSKKTAGQAKGPMTVHLQYLSHLPRPDNSAADFLLVSVAASNSDAWFFMPLGIVPEEMSTSTVIQQHVICRVRQGAKVGLLVDAYCMDEFALTLVEQFRHSGQYREGARELRFESTASFDALDFKTSEGKPGLDIRRPHAEQSNSSLIINDLAIVKMVRHFQPGTHPELEMAQRLDELGYHNTPALLGHMAFTNAEGESYTQIVMQAYVHNQGDAWQWTIDRLGMAIQQLNAADIAAQALAPEDTNAMKELQNFAAMLGKRLAELHNLLSLPTVHEAFKPQQMGKADITALKQRIVQQWREAFAGLAHFKADNLADPQLLPDMLGRQKEVFARVEALIDQARGQALTRIHGDFHLGQVLVVGEDVLIIDFEGEPARPLPERRQKDNPLRDVAGLIRSFSYVAAFIEKSELYASSGGSLPRRQILQRYKDISETAFLQSYFDHALPHPLSQPEQSLNAGAYAHASDMALLQLYKLEKVGYEIAYELMHRPSWTEVPLEGLKSLLQELAHDKPHHDEK